MGEIEFSKNILKLLDDDMLRLVLKRAVTQGFTVQGFAKNVWSAPEALLSAALEKKKRGKYQSSIFLEAINELESDDDVICLAKNWIQNEDARAEVEHTIEQLELCKTEQKKKEINLKDKKKQENNIKENQEEKEKSIHQLQLKIKKLQSTIQDLRIGTDNYQKRIVHLQKENAKLSKQIEKSEHENNKLNEQISYLNNEIIQIEKKLSVSEQEKLNYQEILKKVPRVLCFSKTIIEKELFPFYNVEQIGEWKDEYEKAIKWNEYREIWIVETDFNYPEVLKIKKLPCKKIVLSHNVKSLIEKVGGTK